MKSITRAIYNPSKFIYKQLYASSGDKNIAKVNLELVDIPTEDEIEFEVEEVRITLPWKGAYIAGKWWGSKDQRPIVCLHGWQDNAGTFDRLIPLLPKNLSYLAIDLPGHGLSSRVPDGMAYHGLDNLYLLSHLCKEYNWDKISLMGHSMGSALSFVFATVFPNKVDMIIQIDSLKPHIHNPKRVVEFFEDRVENFMLADQRNQANSEPPSYSYEEMVDRLVSGSFDSVNKECAPFLLKRNIRKSEKYPGKFYFTRDSRVKYSYGVVFSQELSVELAKRIKIPHMFIKAKQSPFYERRRYFDEVIEVLNQNPKFELHFIDSTHHLHLTEPEKVAPVIIDFIEKHRVAVASKL